MAPATKNRNHRRHETGAGTRSRSRGWKGQVTDNAPSRSIRRSGHPILASAASRLRAFDRDLIRGEHYGQRPSQSAASTGRTDGSTDQHCITVQKSLANREPSTDGYKRTLWARASNVRFTPESRHQRVEISTATIGCRFDKTDANGPSQTAIHDSDQKHATPPEGSTKSLGPRD